MQKVTLAKALKLKKRLAEQVSKLASEITRVNTVVTSKVLNAEGKVLYETPLVRDFDVSSALTKRTALKANLVILKVNLNKANLKQQDKLLRMAEIKDEITFYKGLTTNHGEVNRTAYDAQNQVTVYDSFIKRADVDATVSSLQKELDDLQEEVDSFNWKTTVEVPDDILG